MGESSVARDEKRAEVGVVGWNVVRRGAKLEVVLSFAPTLRRRFMVGDKKAEPPAVEAAARRPTAPKLLRKANVEVGIHIMVVTRRCAAANEKRFPQQLLPALLLDGGIIYLFPTFVSPFLRCEEERLGWVLYDNGLDDEPLPTIHYRTI